MTLDALRCFCAVVDTRSFRAAADAVHRSQPAVSQQIKSLERELGSTLVERASCKPTPAGETLCTRAHRLLLDASGITQELADFDDSRTRGLRLGTSDTTALYLLPPVIRKFSRIQSQTRLTIVNRPSEAIADHVIRGALDIGIVTLPVRHADLEERSLFTQQFVLVASTRHRLRSARRVSLRTLRDEPFLILDESTRSGQLLRDHFRSVGFEPRVVLDSGSFEVIKRYVSEDVGIAFLPSDVITNADRNLTSIRVAGLPTVNIGAIRRKGAYCTRGEHVFLELLQEQTTRPLARAVPASQTRG